MIGDGITEALLQARSLADAIEEGGTRALTCWWRARDVEALPGYFWGRDQGAPGPPGDLESMVIAKVAGDERLRRRMTLLPEHECSPYDALPVSTVLPVLLRGLLHGRVGLIREFVVQGRRAAEYARAARHRRRLLEAARALDSRTAAR